MKITIAYIPSEAPAAEQILRFVCGLLPGAKVRKSDRHPSFKHIYLTMRKPQKRCESKKTT